MRTEIAVPAQMGIDMAGMAAGTRAETAKGMCAAMYRAMLSDGRRCRAVTSSCLKGGPRLHEELPEELLAAVMSTWGSPLKPRAKRDLVWARVVPTVSLTVALAASSPK